MRKVINFLKEPLYFPILVLGIMYIIWLLTAPMDILGDDNFSNYFAGVILFCVYILLSRLAKFVIANRKLVISFFILALPLLFYTTLYIAWQLSELQQSGQFERTGVFIAASLLTTIYPAVSLLSRPTSKSNGTSLFLFFILLPILEASILYPIHFYPRTLDSAKLGGYNYYLVSSLDWDNHSFQSFYKCKTWRIGCKELSFSYSGFDRIIVDEQSNEVSLLGYFGLDYTDGEHSRRYSPPAAVFGDHVYQFSYTCNNFNNQEGYYSCESYAYTIYECNLDYKSCNPLPVQYTTEDYDLYLYLVGDDVNKEINIYSDYPEYGGILILTYGEYPRCHIEGCEILSETK
ncbi:MAG: hypothetical protein L0287_00615 [Anaerolineae bacterium]|nr:hypothetical protein [Anaerolineae bacterium]